LSKKVQLPDLKDEALVRKSQRGSKEAFEVLLERHSGLIRSSLFKMGVSEDDTKDILQLTYVKSWTKIKTFKFKSAFATWFFRIGRNSFYDFYRQTQRRTSNEVSYEDFCLENGKNPLDFLQGSDILLFNDDSPRALLEEKENFKILGKVLTKLKNRLNPEQKTVVELIVEQEMSYAEAAKVMKCSIGTIMSRLFYARQRIRKMIESKNLL
jgi:RNA polymerase sigma-70 factor (ECF subfamily)